MAKKETIDAAWTAVSGDAVLHALVAAGFPADVAGLIQDAAEVGIEGLEPEDEDQEGME